jgi:hypothetical protein
MPKKEEMKRMARASKRGSDRAKPDQAESFLQGGLAGDGCPENGAMAHKPA